MVEFQVRAMWNKNREFNVLLKCAREVYATAEQTNRVAFLDLHESIQKWAQNFNDVVLNSASKEMFKVPRKLCQNKEWFRDFDVATAQASPNSKNLCKNYI